MIEDLNTPYPVRSLAERASTVAYFVEREAPTHLLVMSSCHEYDGDWTPEREPMIKTLARAGGSPPVSGPEPASLSIPMVPKIHKARNIGSRFHWKENYNCIHAKRPTEYTSTRVVRGSVFKDIPEIHRCVNCDYSFTHSK